MPRKQKKYHYIYKTTCNVNERYYIGMHSTNNLEDGYMGSGKRLWFSINYHGKENHTKEILEFCETREELKKREVEIVNEQLLNEDLCMNLKTGGDGGGKIWSEEHMRVFSKAGNDKLRELFKDKEFADKHRKATSEAVKKRIKDGKYVSPNKGHWIGRKHTEETKKKMSEAKKGKVSGKNNSQYGTCWITNGKENKKIKKEELTTYISQGWEKGRKINLK
jgi:hypothetical protein